ncbi:MAG: Hpt domain-containing protein [Bdellovibrionota bacterium]
MTQVFDKTSALDRVGQDKELLFELMDMFQSSSQETLVNIDQAIKTSDALKLHQTAHSIKSVLGNIGAVTSFELAGKLEAAGREDNLDLALDLFTKLKTEIEKFKAEVEEFRKES